MNNGPSPTGILADIPALIASGRDWLPCSVGLDELVLWLALVPLEEKGEREDLLKSLETGPLIATRSGRITGRQAQRMPTQGSTKESITAGASDHKTEVGATSRAVQTQRTMEATRSLRDAVSYHQVYQKVKKGVLTRSQGRISHKAPPSALPASADSTPSVLV